MAVVTPDIDSIVKELRFTTSRSGGPGGQGVNKVNTKVVLHWSIEKSSSLNSEQKGVIENKLAKKINSMGEVVLAAQASRSQLENKDEAINKLKDLITSAFKVRKARKPTKPSKSSIKKRLDNKKRHGKQKKLRKGFED